jgi:hypothetical protein
MNLVTYINDVHFLITRKSSFGLQLYIAVEDLRIVGAFLV